MMRQALIEVMRIQRSGCIMPYKNIEDRRGQNDGWVIPIAATEF